MAKARSDSNLPAGRPPWDPWNGARVGALAGGVVGIAAVALAGSSLYWVGLATAAVGALAGYLYEKRKQHRISG